MLVIRFNRVGRKNKAQYRIAVQEKNAAPGGRHKAIVGSYDPHSKAITLQADEIKRWIANGAQPSDSVHNLLVREGVITAPKRTVKLPEKVVEETPVEEAPAAAEAEAPVEKTDEPSTAPEEALAKEEKKEMPAEKPSDAPEKEKPAA